MNKKLKRLKKEIKRNLKEIGFKRSCRNLKEDFLRKNKTEILIILSTLPGKVFPRSEICELENSRIVGDTNCFLPLSIEKATKKIIEWKKYSKVVVSCYNSKKKEESWFTI